jgi:hypothetical protein
MPAATRRVTVLSPAFAPDTVSLLNRMTTAPGAARRRLIDTCIRALIASGIWAKLDILYVLAAHDAQAARLNWKAPGSFTLTATNAPTFTSDRGYAGDGSTSYLDTGWAPATNGVNYTQDSAAYGVWSLTSAQSAAGTFGTRTSTDARAILRNASDQLKYTINSATQTTIANTDASGLFVVSRSAAAVTQSYRNGAALGAAGSGTSAALSAVNFGVGEAGAAFSSYQVAAAFTGGNLSAAEQASLYTALQAFLHALGAV